MSSDFERLLMSDLNVLKQNHSGVQSEPVLYTDMLGTNYTRARAAEFAKKVDNYHIAVRRGMVMERVQDWCRKHPEATKEQIEASARRYIAFINSNPSFFKRIHLEMSLMKRSDLETTLEPDD